MNLKYINPYYMIKNRSNRSAEIYEFFEDPIYDRTEEDINNLRILLQLGYKNFNEEQKTLWASDIKGALNASDLNRIEKNIYILCQVLSIEIERKIWLESDIPQISDFKRLSNGLMSIVSKLEGANLTINVPDLPWNTYVKINDVEKLTLEIFNILKSQFYYFCTNANNIEIYCGEEIGIN